MADSPIITVAVGKYPTLLSVQATPSSGPAPLTVNITGNLTKTDYSGVVGRTITIYVDGESVGTATTIKEGYYSLSNVVFTAPGSYSVQSKFAGDAYFEGCEISNGATVIGEEVPPSPLIPLAVVGMVLGSIYLLTKKK